MLPSLLIGAAQSTIPVDANVPEDGCVQLRMLDSGTSAAAN